MNNNEWKAEINVKCLMGHKSWPIHKREQITPKYLGDEVTVVERGDGHGEQSFRTEGIRLYPLKTSLQIYREKLESEMFNDLYSLSNMSNNACREIAKRLLVRNWIKHRELTKDVIDKLWKRYWLTEDAGHEEFARMTVAYVRGEINL